KFIVMVAEYTAAGQLLTIHILDGIKQETSYALLIKRWLISSNGITPNKMTNDYSPHTFVLKEDGKVYVDDIEVSNQRDIFIKVSASGLLPKNETGEKFWGTNKAYTLNCRVDIATELFYTF